MSCQSRISRTDQYYDPIELAQRQFSNVFSRLVNRGENGATPYGVDVRADTDHIYVEAELPGFTKDEVDITLEDSTLTLTAQHKEAAAEGNANKGDWLLRERRFNRVQRSFTLPQSVDEQSVKAALADGVLTITLNKREETKPRKVPVM